MSAGEASPRQGWPAWVKLSLAFAVILAVTLLAYRGLLWPASSASVYPWSSDGWGHIMKTDYLLTQIETGHFYPKLFTYWYGGIEPFRDYGLVTYYLMVGLAALSGSVFKASSLFIVLCALAGGAFFIPFRRWLGLVPATIAGALFVIFPDNIRIALAEGNMPRVLATALMPLAFFFLLQVLHGRLRWHVVFLALATALLTMAHAQMAAIALVCMALFAVVFWLSGYIQTKRLGFAAVGMATGVLLTSWWLAPSLSGGAITIDKQTSSEAFIRFGFEVSLNPFLRTGDKEIYYIGLSLALLCLLVFLLWRRTEPLAKSLAITSVVAIIVTTPFLAELYNSLPGSYLLRPQRWLSFAGMTLLLTAAALLAWAWRRWRARNLRFWVKPAAFGLVVLMVVLDFAPSLGLIFCRAAPNDLIDIAGRLQEEKGWREATLDLSRLGSAPSYFFSADGEREQVFGWAYHGSTIVDLISSINFALRQGYHAYALDTLDLMGVDDIILLPGVGIADDFASLLEGDGWQLAYTSERVLYYHRDGVPRAHTSDAQVLGIGRGCFNLDLLFPQIEVGTSTYLDDYSPEFLGRYSHVVLSYFNWHSKEKAEELVTNYVKNGGQAVVDLGGAPVDVLSKEPLFLGVYGEPISEGSQVTLMMDGAEMTLLPFSADYPDWNSYSPQGLDEDLITFNYLDETAVALGYKRIDGGRVDFIGLNLFYHAVLTRDPVAISIIEGELGIKADALAAAPTVTMEDYSAQQDGYRFSYQTDRAEDLVVPVAWHSGLVVEVDGRRVEAISINELVSFTAPAGRHSVFITLVPTAAFYLGLGATGAGIILLILIWFGAARKEEGRSAGQN